MRIGRQLGGALSAGNVVSLQGPLGAGKTTLVKGIARGLDIPDTVTSPSFTIMTIYQGQLPLYHIDLYRIDTQDDLDYLGLEDYLFGDGVSVVEWGEKAAGLLPSDHISIKIKLIGNDSREIEIRGITL